MIGSILVLDLRLLGLFPRLSLIELAPILSRLAGLGLAATLLTGLGLFSVQPSHYLGNPAFLWKLGLIALGLFNVAVTRLQPAWPALRAGAAPNAVLKLTAALSLAVWISALFAGRWIAYL